MNRVPSELALPSRTRRLRALVLASAGIGIGIAGGARVFADNTDAVWIGLGGSTSWLNPTNWNTNIVPDGTSANATFGGSSGGAVVLLGGASISLNRLDLNDPLFTSIVGGTINLVGSAIVHADGTNFDLPDKVFTTFGSTNPSNLLPGNNIGGVGTYSAAFVGTNGLNKRGDSHLQINSQQFYSGTTSIAQSITSEGTIVSGGKIITAVGDGAFGISTNAIALNDGTIQVAATNWGSAGTPVNRTINIGTLGGSIYWVDTNRSIDFGSSAQFTGSGTLLLNGRFGSNVGSATIRASNSFSGTLNIGGGSVNLRDNGAFTSIPKLINAGTLILDNSNSGSISVDRLGNSVPVTLRGAAITAIGGASGLYSETIGTTTLAGGVSYLTVSTPIGGGGVQVSLSGFIRENKAGLIVRGNNLGLAPGAGNTNVYINDGTSLLNQGIIPFAWANGTFTNGSSSPENANNLLATYGANGVAPIPIASYVTNFTAVDYNTNVRVTSDTTVGGQKQINALVIAAPSNLIRTGTFGFTGGLTVSSGVLRIDSGVVLSANSASLNVGTATILNSSPGNIISADLDFGDDDPIFGSGPPAVEAIFLTPSALRVTGLVKGINGLTKIGPRTLELTNPLNTYTGTTTLTGFNRFQGNVSSDGTPSPYGKSTSPIQLYGGNADGYTPSTSTINGTGLGVLGSSSPGSIQFNRALDLRGDWIQLRNFGNGTNTGTILWNGAINTYEGQTLLQFLTSKSSAHQVVNSIISGPGKVVIVNDPNPGASGDPEETWVDLMQPNSFAGGLVISGGTVGLGADGAMGTGSVQFNGSGLISGLNAPRTIDNKLVIYSTTLGIGGNQDMTFTNEINGRGGDFIANITNSANTTFAGAITGGGFYKQGMGTLTLKGNNSFTGVLKVGNGSFDGGMVILQSNTALGATSGPSGVEAGQNTLALDGAMLPDGRLVIGQEPLYFRGAGVGSIGALYSKSGDNIWGNSIYPSARYVNEGTGTVAVDTTAQFATIGVGTASILTITGAILADDPGAKNGSGTTVFLANSIGVHKAGAGTLIVGAHVVDTTIGSTNFNWNGAIIASGSLNIQQGAVRIQPQAGVPSIAGGRSLVDVGAIVIAGGSLNPSAQLDLSDNAFIIDYASITPIQEIRNYVRAGYNNGSWNGNGITSSRASTSPNAGEEGLTALGFAEATALGVSVWYGDPLNGAALVMRYTYFGDANLDGMVNATDLTRMAQNWNLANRSWYDGDFDYNGVVDTRDLVLLSNNWYVGITNPLGSAPLAAALEDLNLPPIAVPEPVFGVLLPLSVVGSLLARKRRNANPLTN